MAYAIRPFWLDDAEALAEITLAAIRTVGAHAYSPKQVAAWAARHPGSARFIERFENGAHITVAADASDVPVAYCLLEIEQDKGGHLDMLYCRPDHTRKGLAVQLLATVEQQAGVLGVTRLYTEASELARPAFERAGYTVMHRRDFEIGGVPIHNYAMEKRLD